MSNENFTIRVSRDNYVLKYIQLRTFNLLSKTQYKVLAEIIKRNGVNTEVRKDISLRLGITIFSLNNVLLTLKKKGLLVHDPSCQTYTAKIDVPREPGSITYNFMER